VATKALPNQQIPAQIKPVVGEHTSILLLQNGMFIEQEYKDAFPDTTIIRGLAFVCVSKPEPGKIFHQDYGRIVIGRYPNGNSVKVEKISALFNQAGVPCNIDDQIQKSSWRKLIWNAPFNPLSVIGGGVNTQEMLSLEASKDLVEKVMSEVCQLAQKEGYDLGPSDIKRNIENTLTMHPYKTSMLLDYENNRKMEVEAILGNALRFAKSHDLSVPYMESLYVSLKLLELKTESQR
jgi:2-dehydropantoate 2-reductase